MSLSTFVSREKTHIPDWKKKALDPNIGAFTEFSYKSARTICPWFLRKKLKP